MGARRDAGELEFETATVTGRDGHTVHTDRGELRAPLIVDALGWRRVLSNGPPIQPPDAPLSRGLEVHPPGRGEEMELWIDPRYVRAGYGWSFPAARRAARRRGLLLARPPRQGADGQARARPRPAARRATRATGSPTSCARAVEDGVFFAGDSAGHCLPLTAEGIRTALYFGLACGRELRAVLDGQRTREQALARYGAFSDAHARKYRWLLGAQRAVGQMTPSRARHRVVRAFENRRAVDWIFDHYLAIAPPSFVAAGAGAGSSGERPRQPADALLDRRLGEVGVAEHEAVVRRA